VNEIQQRLQAGIARARQDSEFIAAARGLSCAVWLQAGASGERLAVWNGQPATPSQTVVIRASPATWDKLLSPLPPPGYQSFSAALRQAQDFTVKAEPLALAQSLHLLERCFEILRGQVEADAPALDRGAIHGHYAAVTLDGAAGSLYVESSGLAAGPTLLMLHTAGADSRQFHGLMTDAALRAQWRMLAFDMPAHGRSMPWPGRAWTAGGLTREAYLATCLAVIRQVARQPVVLLGCSMGAAMALYIAARSPRDVAGVVALEAPWKAAGRRTPLLCHPEVNQAAHNPAYVRGLMAPHTTLAARREAAWIYAQGGFGVYADDLHFYSEDFDAPVHLAGLDAASFGISLLTGAYDYSASPEDSRRVAALIPGARFTLMPDLGHFPMVEDPQRLLRYLRPELARLHPSPEARP